MKSPEGGASLAVSRRRRFHLPLLPFRFARLARRSPLCEDDHRTFQDQDGRADQVHHPRGAGVDPAKGPFQPLPNPRGRGDHRPADRQRHGRHEQRTVGRHAARRRVLRRSEELVSLRVGPPRFDRHAPYPAHPPGPSERTHPVRTDRRAGQGHPQQQPFRHHAAPTSSIRRPRAVDLVIAEGACPSVRHSLQGKHGRAEAPAADRRGRRRANPALHVDGDEQ